MSNLIPQFAKKKVTTEYWVRVLTIWFILWSVGFFIASILLFPVYIYTNVQIDVQSASAATAEQSVANYESVAADLKKASLQARYIIEDNRRTQAHRYAELIDRNEGAGIAVTLISFSTAPQGIEPIIISGVADTRESLAAFRDRLLAESVVEQADLPISNLAKDQDINFTITLTLARGATI